MPEHDCVFVYGTLMPGEPRWHALAPYATTWFRATARGRLWDTGRGFPAVRFDLDGDSVAGFVVVLSSEQAAEAIAQLDRIEGEGVLYRRVVVETSAGPATSYEWIGPTDGLFPLSSGWKGSASSDGAPL